MRYRFGGLIHGGAYFRNFTVSRLAPAHHRKNFRSFSLSKPPQLFIKPVFHKVLNVKFTKNLRQISVCKDFELIIEKINRFPNGFSGEKIKIDREHGTRFQGFFVQFLV